MEPRKGTEELKRVGKDALITGVLAVIAILSSVSAGWIVFDTDPSSHKQALTPEEEIALVKSREIIDYTVITNDGIETVVYAYVGSPLPEMLAEHEVRSLRKENAYSIELPRDGGERQLQTILYPQPQFTERADGWHYVEYASALRTNFEKATNNPFSLLVRVAHAATATIFSGAGDGDIRVSSNGAACTGVRWATAQLAVSGTADVAAASASVRDDHESTDCAGKSPTEAADVFRIFLPFDTSSIPVTSQVTSATLNVYVTGKGEVANDAQSYIVAVQTSQATHTTLASGDFDNIAAIAGSDTKDITTGITASSYLVFTLNSTGRGWIKKAGEASSCSATTGITCLGIRGGHDVETVDVDPMAEQVNISTSEEASTSQDPFLSITHSPPFAFWQFQDF